MTALTKAFQCFVGAWGFLNGTITNTTTGELLPDWHSPYPSGISVYAPSGYFSYDVTANDTTQPEFRPRNVSLPAQPGDSVNAWATIAQHSLGGGGPFTLVNVTEGSNNNATTWSNGTSSDGIRGTQLSTFRSATLPALVGVTLENEFEFFDRCDVHMLRSSPAPGTVQTAFFYRLPENAATA
ncbi:hypothetical protein B0J12DRAFT_741323 [Macrophomina phaseolina]|uniref:Lipocalin-like domain-containing protein n=1 Tax=Macrophomina phaseolina TaxID=35725 RepID=A0ABQ8G7M8_9PEZI|nr:hypothetical protein B0J12DRAFT_741323 [Macrophomina phaseolina]